MTDRIYILRDAKTGRPHGKFYTSPFTAALAGERLRRTMPEPENTFFVPDMYVLDIEDVPCDHTVVKDFVTGFVGHLLSGNHEHGMVLIEKNICLFELVCRGRFIAEVLILYIPPSLDPDDVNDLGEPVMRVMTTPEPDAVEALRSFERMFVAYCDSSW